MKPIFFALILSIPFFHTVAAAHWIVGYVEDAADGTSPNGRTARVWNDTNLYEAFDTIGPAGQSATSNVFMIDCELFTVPCLIGDTLNVTVVDDGSGYITKQILQVTVTDAGFDIAQNLSINSPPTVSSVFVEDFFTIPANEIDLSPNVTTKINCSGIIQDYDGEGSISSHTAKFFDSAKSFEDPDDNNNHYTNSSCRIDASYGSANELQINCTFEIEYYASSDNWQCQINATDNYSVSKGSVDTTFINALLAIGTNSTLDFGTMNSGEVGTEKSLEVLNLGNVILNLSISGYAESVGDGLAMNCSTGNISVEHAKYNFSDSNPGAMTLSQTGIYYKNLSTNPVIEEFKLNYRQDDISNDAKNNTYWRIYAPVGVFSPCSGSIVMGATQD